MIQSISRSASDGSRYHALHRILMVAYLTIGTCFGCGSQRATPKDADQTGPRIVDDKTIPPAEFKESMECLSRSADRPGDVPWGVARTLGEFSFIAYASPEEQETEIKRLGAKVVCPIIKGSSHGVVASDDHVVVIAFRGTANATDWLTDATIVGHRVADGNIHKGFHQAVDALFIDTYEEAIRQGAKDKAVWVTGHSLGGAMAVVFAYRAIVEKEFIADGVVTFGQPLVFTESLAQKMLNQYGNRYIRFVNRWDPVTRLLPTYRHAGSRVHLEYDGYSIRRPMIAVSAPADGPTDRSPTVLGFEEEDDLKPMTEAEFREFQEQLAAAQRPSGDAPPRSSDSPMIVGAASIPLYSSHLMGTYRERLKSIAELQGKR